MSHLMFSGEMNNDTRNQSTTACEVWLLRSELTVNT
jgi:hypothetical protein